MAEEVTKFWRCLEDLRGLVHVPAGWRARLDGEFDAVRGAFLRARPSASARSYPCPHECGCSHEVVRHDDGRIVGVCRCESWNCDDLPLREEDLVLLELNWSKLGRAIASTFGCDAKESVFGMPGVMQVASFGGAALPVVLCIQHEPGEFRSALTELAVRLREGFILLAPTNRFVDGNCKDLLASSRAGCFDLESHVTLAAQGNLRARKRGVELFVGFLPKENEPVPEDVTRQAFRLIEQLDSEQGIRAPSVLTVFRLYCEEELTAEQIARKCRCSKGTVINRLKLIREKTQMEPNELRRFSSQFSKIEDDVRESKATYIHRKRMIDDSPSGEEGE
jgi:hypothetical protein